MLCTTRIFARIEKKKGIQKKIKPKVDLEMSALVWTTHYVRAK